MKQLGHQEVINKKQYKELVVVTENIRTPENVGMLFRISEAFGVSKVFLIGDSPNLENKKVIRTARNTEKQLKINLFVDSQEVITKLKKEKYQLIGLELTYASKSLQSVDFLEYDRIALFVGAERFGIAKSTLLQLDQIVHIDLFGKNSSINVVNAVGIALYEINRN